jgi:transposase
MDRLGAHRPRRVKELVEHRGCELLYLPSYSPDLNPIEEAFSKVEHILRKAAARTKEALIEAMGRALAAVHVEDVRGFFVHLRLPRSGAAPMKGAVSMLRLTPWLSASRLGVGRQAR